MNSRLKALHISNLIKKCSCVFLTLLSSTCEFHPNREHCIFHTDIYTQRKTQGCKVNNPLNGKHSRDFFYFSKLSAYYNTLMFFWKLSWIFLLVWRNNSPTKRKKKCEGFFTAVTIWGLFKNNWSKNILNHLAMNDIGYPFSRKYVFPKFETLYIVQ